MAKKEKRPADTSSMKNQTPKPPEEKPRLAVAAKTPRDFFESLYLMKNPSGAQRCTSCFRQHPKTGQWIKFLSGIADESCVLVSEKTSLCQAGICEASTAFQIKDIAQLQGYVYEAYLAALSEPSNTPKSQKKLAFLTRELTRLGGEQVLLEIERIQKK